MFTLLPECLATVIVCFWLEIDAVRRLDCAYCSHASRAEFLSLLADQTFVKVQIKGSRMLLWLLLRKLTAKEVVLLDEKDKLFQELAAQFLVRCCQSAHGVHIVNQSYGSNLSRLIVQTYHCLNHFSCERISELELYHLLLNNTNLQTLRVVCISTVNFSSLLLPNFQSMSFNFLCTVNAFVTKAIIAAAVNLQKLSVQCVVHNFAFTFESTCLHLKSFSLQLRHIASYPFHSLFIALIHHHSMQIRQLVTQFSQLALGKREHSALVDYLLNTIVWKLVHSSALKNVKPAVQNCCAPQH